MLSGYALSFSIFPYALKRIPLSIAYATWSGAGMVLTTALDYFVFGMQLSVRKYSMVLLIILGVVGLNVI
jgi:small multidrug resistance pump